MDCVTVLIPAYKNEIDTEICLKSLFETSFPEKRLEVIVIDNSEDKKTEELIKKKYPTVKIILPPKNIGYVNAINKGIEKSKSNWIFITNNDVSFDKNIFKHLLEFASKSKKIGILGPQILSFTKKNTPSKKDMPGFSCNFDLGKINSLSVEQISKLKKPIEVDWVSGCGIFIKKEVIKKIGSLDPRLYSYWEDSDLGIRAKKAGYEIYFVPAAKLWHKGSSSMGETPQKIYYLVRNSRIVLTKHLNLIGKASYLIKEVIFITGTTIRFIFDYKKRSFHRAKFLGLWDYYIGRFGERKIIN